MSFDYSSVIENTISQINNFGRTVTYRSLESGVYDPATGTLSGEETTDTEIKAVVTTAKTEKIDGSAVQRGDRFYLIAADEVSPNVKDIIIDTETYQVIDFVEIKTGDSAIAYKIQARK